MKSKTRGSRAYENAEEDGDYEAYVEKENESQPDGVQAVTRSKGTKKRKQVTGHIPAGLPDRFFNEEGEVDLRQVTGAEALKYFSLQGIKLPVFNRLDRKA